MGDATVTDELRERILGELSPEVGMIANKQLATQVVEAWAMAIAASSMDCISDMKASGNPDTAPISAGTQAEHLRGVARAAVGLADALTAVFPDLKVNRDVVVAGGLCHDLGKAWEFDPENQKRWKADPRAVGFPSVRHPPYGVHAALSAGLPEAIVHIAGAHSGEGELVVRSLECTIVHSADYAFWDALKAGGMLDEGRAR
jgi:putative nucleotidyltransferase with HDIG domain